jgi:hypothetical protein
VVEKAPSQVEGAFYLLKHLILYTMSKSSVKHHIMEVLMRAENGLSNEEISWAIRNIPDEDAPGVVPGDPVVYNHEHNNIFDACGISDEVADRIQEEYREIRLSSPKGSKSMIIQALINNGSPDLIRSLVIRGVRSIEIQRSMRESESDMDIVRGAIGMSISKDKLAKLLDQLSADSDGTPPSEKPKAKDDFQEKLRDLLRKLKGGS